MKRKDQGRKCALLFALILCLNGCAGREEVYVAGMQPQEQSDAQETSAEQERVNTGEVSTAQERSNAEEALSGQEQLGAEEIAAEAEQSDAEPESEGYLYVCGAVNAPGVYPVYAGMRVFEALALAGGFAPDADREWLNQAEPVQDGQRLYVYTLEETRLIREGGQESQTQWQEDVVAFGVGNAGNGGANGGTACNGAADDRAADAGAKINLNTADREQLKTLPGIGDAKADAILRYREEHGAFGTIEEIQNISGIKSGVFAKIRDLITV